MPLEGGHGRQRHVARGGDGRQMIQLLTAYALSGPAGIRSSWVMLVISCAVRFGYLHPPESLAWVGSWWMIAIAFVGSIIDFIGDKIPALDHALQRRPHDPRAARRRARCDDRLPRRPHDRHRPRRSRRRQRAAAAHRAIGRTCASTATTAGIANPLISILEDIFAAVFIAIAIVAPILAAVFLVILTIWLVKKARRVTATLGVWRAQR